MESFYFILEMVLKNIYISGVFISLVIILYEITKTKKIIEDFDKFRVFLLISTFSLLSWFGLFIWMISDTKKTTVKNKF